MRHGAIVIGPKDESGVRRSHARGEVGGRAKKRRALEEEPRRPRAPKKLEDDVGKSLCVKELLL